MPGPDELVVIRDGARISLCGGPVKPDMPDMEEPAHGDIRAMAVPKTLQPPDSAAMPFDVMLRQLTMPVQHYILRQFEHEERIMKFAVATIAALTLTAPAFAGSLAGAEETQQPDAPVAAADGSGGLTGAVIGGLAILALLAAADSSSGTP